MGRSDIFLKLETIKKIIGLIVLICVARFGVLAIAVSTAFMTIIISAINAYPNLKLLNYGYFEQLKDLFNGIIPLLLMSVVVFLIGLFDLKPLWEMSIQILAGMLVYIGTSFVARNDSFQYIIYTGKGFIKKRG